MNRNLLEVLKKKALVKGLLKTDDEITLAKTYELVRDMPYQRATTRDPETIIDEWRGTCSGKHYLLQALFDELGYTSKLVVCTTIEYIDPKEVKWKLRKLLEQSNGRFVDVHNYLLLETGDAEMIVDATWPLSTKGMGTVVNEHFIEGEDQKIACEPIKKWIVPKDRNPQEFKDEILRSNFTEKELEHRDEFIKTLGKMSGSKWIKLLIKLENMMKNRSAT